MKWFKHVSDSLDDPMIYDLMTEFGSDAYLVFFGVLEKYSREFSPENGWNLVINPSFFRQKFRVSQNKINQILSKIPKWNVEFKDGKVSIFIPKFTQLLDNYTRNNNPKDAENTCKLIASDLQETFQPLKKKDQRRKIKEERINTKEPPISPAKRGNARFDIFWTAYPKKKSKGQAEKAWLKMNPDEQLLASMIATIERAKKSEDWTKENGKYIPHPATWLTAKGWEDEDTEIHPLSGKVSEKTLKTIEMLKDWRPPANEGRNEI